MKVVMKVLLCFLGAGAVLAIVVIGGMPWAGRGELHLAGDYYFAHWGGAQNSIVEGRDGVFRYVVDQKVEEFLAEGGAIFVTRRPALGPELGRDTSNLRPDDVCEYYKIDVADRKLSGPFTLADVKNRADWAFLKRRPSDSDFGPTVCKLDAIR